MFFFDCENGYVPDNGQNDVIDGSVENYDFDWQEDSVSPQATTDTPSTENQGTSE